MQFAALLFMSLREALDRKIFWVLVGLSVLIALCMLCVGFEGDRINVLFGMWKAENTYYSPIDDLGRQRLVGFVVYFLLGLIVGLVGVVLMIIATASQFPSMMDSGAIDVLVSKPIGRAKLFLYKYLSGMVFVALQGLVFVGLTFLVMGLRWGVWVPGYLLSVPLLVLLFSYVYCVSVLVAVKTRSAVAAILISLAAWVGFMIVHQAPDVFEVYPELKEHRMLYNTVCVVAAIPPKTGDFDYLAARWANAGTSAAVLEWAYAASTPEEQDRIRRSRDVEKALLSKDPIRSIVGSLVFEAVIAAWAMWCFARKDY